MKATELHARASSDFAAKLVRSQDLLRQAARDFAPLTQASSLGAEDMVISHLIEQMQLHIPIFVLDTGKLHSETLALLELLRAQYQTPITVYRPLGESVVRFVAREGHEAMFKSVGLRKACCEIRKVEPLARALAGQRAWITGLRRDQADSRTAVGEIEQPEHTSAKPVKFNPLAAWSWGDVWHFIASEQVPYNPLHNSFYPSIGCAPCTRAISAGEDLRAGRWWWESEATKECGLHTSQHARNQVAHA